jgi:hydroxymethylpyrimidine/phosphomethylpyrimidine kinase
MAGRDRRARRERASTKQTIGRIKTPPVVLTIAGSDSSSGAGIQADLKTFSALGVYGLTAITCIVAEIPRKVSRIERVSTRMVHEQIEVLAKNFRIDAIKTGVLCSAEIVSAVAKAVRGIEAPLIVDPVIVATSGDRLLEADAIEAYKHKLFPLASLITPNIDEAEQLLGTKINDRESFFHSGQQLEAKFGIPVLLKGGHLAGQRAVDLLFSHGQITEFSAPFIRGVATHGTGCTYSAAITAGLARGLLLEQAIRRGKEFVTASIAQRFRWKSPSGKTVDALRHLL